MMRYVLIYHQNHPDGQPVRARYCNTFFCRLRGFTFRRRLAPGEALLLVQPRQNRLDAGIHMLGVLTDLAVFWINDHGDVVDLCLARRWQPIIIPRRPARYVLEMAPDRLPEFRIGDRVSIEEISLD